MYFLYNKSFKVLGVDRCSQNNLVNFNRMSYAILNRDTVIYKNAQIVFNSIQFDEEIKLEGGNLVQLIQENGRYGAIKIFSLEKNELLWSTDMYGCLKEHLTIFPKRTWSFLLAVKHIPTRLNCVKRDKFLKFVGSIKVGQQVTVSNKSLPLCKNDVPCVVKYVGEVPEMGPGIYFGLTFVDSNEKIQQKSKLVERYFSDDNTNSFFRSCDCFLNLKPMSTNTSNVSNIKKTEAEREDEAKIKKQQEDKNFEIEKLKKEIELLKLQQQILQTKEQLTTSAGASTSKTSDSQVPKPPPAKKKNEHQSKHKRDGGNKSKPNVKVVHHIHHNDRQTKQTNDCATS